MINNGKISIYIFYSFKLYIGYFAHWAWLFSSVGRALDSKSKGHRFNSGKGQLSFTFSPGMLSFPNFNCKLSWWHWKHYRPYPYPCVTIGPTYINNELLSKTQISFHDVFIPDNTATQFTILDKDIRNRVTELYEEQKNNGIEGYTTFKFKCVESANKIEEKTYCQAKQNKSSISEEIEEMRKVWRWTESVNMQENKGKEIKERE